MVSPGEGHADTSDTFSTLPVLDLSWAADADLKPRLLQRLRDALFNVGFLYIINHGVEPLTISDLASRLPALFDLPDNEKHALSKLNSPHFLGYSGYAEETTLGKQDLREQFDLATELPCVEVAYSREQSMVQRTTRASGSLFWRLRGPNQWPTEDLVPGFRKAFIAYHDAVQDLSYRFVHLIEEAFEIPVGTFDAFFQQKANDAGVQDKARWMSPQHRLKLIKYPPSSTEDRGQGVGAHKDSSGWLTFLYQVGKEEGLEVLNAASDWITAPPIENSFVVNFGNAFEAATEGAVKATVHRVRGPTSTSDARYSIPFFQGLPLDLSVSEIQSYIPERVRHLRKADKDGNCNTVVASFLDSRWDSLGESQLRKWIRSHQDVGRKWYGDEAVDYYIN